MRNLPRFIALAPLAIAFALLSGDIKAAEKERVLVYNWSDYIDRKLLQDFAKETGI